MKFLAATIVSSTLFLAGCASQYMGEMVGKDISQIVAQYGPPANSFDTPDGRRAFQWRMNSDLIMPVTTTVTGQTYGAVTTANAVTSGGYLGSYTCFYTLYTQKNGPSGWTVVGFEKPTAMCE
jgi:hypothetical protein